MSLLVYYWSPFRAVSLIFSFLISLKIDLLRPSIQKTPKIPYVSINFAGVTSI